MATEWIYDDRIPIQTILDSVYRKKTSPSMSAVPRIDLDWQSYFYAFDAEHGGGPIQYGKLLLYRDGWRYSATNYEGPEYPPPEDPAKLRKLQSLYWKRRRTLVNAEYVRVSRAVQNFYDLQYAKSLPLRGREVFINSDDRREERREIIDINFLETVQESLKGDLDECDQRIQELSDGPETT